MILCIENPKDSTINLLDLINEFSNLAGYKILRNLLHFYTPIITHKKGKLGKDSHLQLHPNKIKYLGIYLTKKVKDLSLENYKTLKEKIEEDTRNKLYTMFMDSNN